MTLDRQILSAIGRHRAVRTIELGGSRAEGRETALSDWDFIVATDDFPALARDLPSLCAPLGPLGATTRPASAAEAVDVYRDARTAAERRFGYEMPRELETAVADTVLAED